MTSRNLPHAHHQTHQGLKNDSVGDVYPLSILFCGYRNTQTRYAGIFNCLTGETIATFEFTEGNESEFDNANTVAHQIVELAKRLADDRDLPRKYIVKKVLQLASENGFNLTEEQAEAILATYRALKTSKRIPSREEEVAALKDSVLLARPNYSQQKREEEREREESELSNHWLFAPSNN